MADEQPADTAAPATGLLGNTLTIEEAIDQQIGADPLKVDTPPEPLETEVEAKDTFAPDEAEPLDAEADTDADDPALDDEDPVEQPPDDTLITVGEEQISLTELKRGHLRQADYTRKSQAQAAQKLADDNERVQMREERELYSQSKIFELESLQNMLGHAPVESSFGDQHAYLKAKDLYRDQADNLARRHSEFQEVQQRRANDLAAQNKQALDYGSAQLIENIPEWKDAAVASSDHAEIREYLTLKGYSQNDVETIVDHRAVEIARDAVLGHNIRTGKELKEKRKAKTGATLRATGEPAPKPKARSLKSANERLNQTGDIDDAVELQLARLGSKGNSHGSRRPTN